MDLLVGVERPTGSDLDAPSATDSATVRERVAHARERQRHRFGGVRCNGEMDAREVRRHVRLEPAAREALGRAYSAGTLSARGRHRIMRVARTIADLAHHERVTHEDLLAALSLRQRGFDDATLAA
jgi:magnesium chelatase family protein